MDLPRSLQEYLVRDAVEDRRAAWVRVARRGDVESCGGDLERYGLADLEVGAPFASRAEFAEGLLPLEGGPLVLPHIAIAGHVANLHLIPEGESTMLVLFDSAREARERGALQQMGNDLSLIRGRDPVRVDVLGIFGLVLYERCADTRFEACGAVPEWTASLAWEPVGGRGLASGEGLSFLENFLVDAEAFWAAGEPGLLRSGTWCEAGAKMSLEAFALRTREGRDLLALERLGPAFEERERLLQRARETSLGLERLVRDVEHKEVLLHCIVHDLRAPLTGVMGALSLLSAAELTPEKRAKLLDMGLRQARAQEQLIQRVLEVFSAELDELESFSQDPEGSPDLVRVAREVSDRFRPAFQAQGVELELVAPLGLGHVAGRVDRLERVLANLLENTLRCAPRGSAVRVEIRPEAENLRCAVLDSGPGVPEEQVATLFDRFVRGGQGAGAAGLGLYFCRITLEKWGGEIGYIPRPAGGAEFWFRLPRVRA